MYSKSLSSPIFATIFLQHKLPLQLITCCFLFLAGGSRPQLGLHAGGRSLRSELRVAQSHHHRSADPLPSPFTHSAQPVTALGPLHHALRLLHHQDLTHPWIHQQQQQSIDDKHMMYMLLNVKCTL